MSVSSFGGRAVDLHFEERGTGPPLVILHGLFGSSSNWRTFARRLAATHRVYCLDLRNHGRSPHADEHDYGVMAADVDRFLRAQRVRHAVLIGHSMGGKAAMQLALERPELLAALVIVDIEPAAYPVDRTVVDALLGVDLRQAPARGDVDAQLSGVLPDAALRAFLLMSLERDPCGDGFRWRFNLQAIAAHYDAIAGPVTTGRYDGPVLFLRGGRSEYVRPHDAAIAARFPGATVRTIPDAGHWLHVDAPDATLEAVRGFATGVSQMAIGATDGDTSGSERV